MAGPQLRSWHSSQPHLGRYVVTAAYDGVATVWCVAWRSEKAFNDAHEVRQKKPEAILRGREGGPILHSWHIFQSFPISGGLYTAVFSPKGQHVLTASADGFACLWRWREQQVEWLLDGHAESKWAGSYLRCASFSRDGRRLVTASADGTVRLWTLGRTASKVVLLYRSSRGTRLTW